MSLLQRQQLADMDAIGAVGTHHQGGFTAVPGRCGSFLTQPGQQVGEHLARSHHQRVQRLLPVLHLRNRRQHATGHERGTANGLGIDHDNFLWGYARFHQFECRGQPDDSRANDGVLRA